MAFYLIQGFFFQNREWLDIAYQAEVDGGAVVVVRDGLCQFMFSGVIYPERFSLTGLGGQMNDHFGNSDLANICISPKEAKFTKVYKRRKDFIKYTFKREGEIWVGGYSGPAVGKGNAKCIITEVPENLFHPPD